MGENRVETYDRLQIAASCPTYDLRRSQNGLSIHSDIGVDHNFAWWGTGWKLPELGAGENPVIIASLSHFTMCGVT